MSTNLSHRSQQDFKTIKKKNHKCQRHVTSEETVPAHSFVALGVVEKKKHDQQHLIWQLLYLQYMQMRDSCHTGVSSLFSSEEGAIIELLHSFRGEMTDK